VRPIFLGLSRDEKLFLKAISLIESKTAFLKSLFDSRIAKSLSYISISFCSAHFLAPSTSSETIATMQSFKEFPYTNI